MFYVDCEKFSCVAEAVKRYTLYGANLPVYIDKQQSYLTKDRVAASFISDKALNQEAGFNNTLIKAERNSKDTALFKSNIPLSYEALISFIYELRIAGYSVTDISNISMAGDKQIISVNEIHTDTDIIKVSVSDKLRTLVNTLIKEHKSRDKERHTSKIVKLKSEESTEYILNTVKIALRQSFTKVSEFTVESDKGDLYYIFDSTNVTCVVGDNHLLFISTQKYINLDEFRQRLTSVCSNHDKRYDIEVTNEIVMF